MTHPNPAAIATVRTALEQALKDANHAFRGYGYAYGYACVGCSEEGKKIENCTAALAALETLSAAQVPELKHPCLKCGHTVFYGASCVPCFVDAHIAKAVPHLDDKSVADIPQAPDTEQNPTASQVPDKEAWENWDGTGFVKLATLRVSGDVEKLAASIINEVMNPPEISGGFDDCPEPDFVKMRENVLEYICTFQAEHIAAEHAASDKMREALKLAIEYIARQEDQAPYGLWKIWNEALAAQPEVVK